MTAQEAANIAKNKNIQAHDSQYNEIMSIINKEAKDGKYKTWYYSSLKSGVKEELERNGYKVKENYERGEILVDINWSL